MIKPFIKGSETGERPISISIYILFVWPQTQSVRSLWSWELVSSKREKPVCVAGYLQSGDKSIFRKGHLKGVRTC